GPARAVARYENGALTIWTHSQGVYPLRGAISELMSMAPERVHCIHMEGSGCYGHNAADDVAADAALVARAVPGTPVRVQWMREDEHAWEPYGPAMIAKVRAALDASGNVAGWQYDVWSNTHSSRPGKAGELAAAAKADPVAFRLRQLDDPRARDVIRFAAERFGWDAYKKQNGRGRGFAFARYKNLAAYCALAMEVEVQRETGELRVLRVV